MSKKICLTHKQNVALNVIKDYYKTNGAFPNAQQFTKAAREAGIKMGIPTANTMYGTLFLKGAFTDGLALCDAAPRHAGGSVNPLNINILKFAPKTLTYGRPKAAGGTVGKAQVSALARAILNLLTENGSLASLSDGVAL